MQSMRLNREELLRARRSARTIRNFGERAQEKFPKGGIPTRPATCRTGKRPPKSAG